MRRMFFLGAVLVLASTIAAKGQQQNKATYGAAMKSLQSTDPTERSFALVNLALIGTDAGPASRQIVEALNDPNADVRKLAATALTTANPPLAKPVLALVNGDSSDQRTQALADLGKLGKDGAAAVPALVNFMDQAKGADKTKAIEALAKVGANDKKLAEQMAKWALTSTDTDVRDAALKALPKMSDSQAMVGAATKVLATDNTAQNRLNAIGVLGSLAKDNSEARRSLEGLSKDGSQQVRDAAKKALDQSKKK